MLSKQEKLKYGEILRQQMKEKEQKKKQERRGGAPAPIIPLQQDRIPMPEPMMNVDPKEILQKKLQTQDYNPFGKAGGGAPNLKGQQNITVNAEGNYSGLAMNSQQQYPPRRQQQQIYGSQDYQPSMQVPTQKYQNSYEMPRNENFRQPEPMQQQYQRPANEYPTRQFQQYPPQQYMEYQPQMEPKMQQQYQPQPTMKGYPEPVRYPEPTFQEAPYSMPTDPRLERGPQVERIRTLQNDEMQEMYKRGGRNLLKLQNETVNEHMVKQKQKLEMQAFLKQQMEEVEHRKMMEKEKIKKEEMEEERRNKEYIAQQNRKLLQDERKKNEERQKIVDENVKNLAKRKQFQQEAKDKLEKERLMQQENERRKEQNEKDRDRDNVRQRERERQQTRLDNERAIGGKVSKMSRQQETQSLSSTSSQHTTQGKGFNTQISREFFRKERERQPQKFRNDKKLEMFTNQIQKMRDQINNQGEMFQKEIERIKRSAEQAQMEKIKAQFEIQKLKLELEKKNRESQLKLLQALKRNDPYNHPPPRQIPFQQEYDSLSEFQRSEQYRAPQQNHRPPPPQSPKMPKTNKVYEMEPLQQRQPAPQRMPQKQSNKRLIEAEYEPRRLEDSDLLTLQADSKKIPLSLQANTKLTISKVENYGKDSYFNQQAKPSKYYRDEPIIEEMQESRVKSRKSQRQVEELDRLVGSRESNRWEMSTVKDDINKEIDELLKKDNKNSYNPIGAAGRQVLSRGGLPYDGNINTMNSNRVSAASNEGTLDIDRVLNRNQARLLNLKAMGVETVNTNNEDDTNRLDILLSKYK